MKPTALDVSVIVPARNAGATIDATIRSLFDQSIGPPHVIVVDDGSTDNTASIARNIGATVVRQGWSGPSVARNRGVEEAETELIAFCDADDTWPVDRLEQDVEFLEKRSDIDLLLGRTRFDTDDNELLRGHHFDTPDRSAVIPHFGAATMRRAVFAKAGVLDPDLRQFEDYDWFLRIREVGIPMVVHDRISLYRHLHRSSTSHINPGTPTDLLSVLHTSLQRRRSIGQLHIPQLSDFRQEHPS